MAERIYVLDGVNLEPMEERWFASEDHLQKLLAEHPHLLDGEQMSPGNPRRWLLVKREMGVPDAAGESDRWSLDHLFVDQDAVPTLVEVKRGSNSQIRREVVGQMLDYAANASQFWDAGTLRRSFEETWGDSADEELRRLLRPDDEEPDADTFWREVVTNLAARRLRLLFVADAIPTELARIVEFLNSQLRDNIEVLAVEVKQFVGSAKTRSTLVPRVIGHTAAPPNKRGASGRRTKIDRGSFMENLPSDEVRRATEQLFGVAEKHDAQVVPGDKGFSIRVKMKPPDGNDGSHLVTVAWFYPPSDTSFWYGLRNYAFGEAVSNYPTDDSLMTPKRMKILDDWVGQFEGDPFGERYWTDALRTRVIAHQEVATHVDTLAARLAKVLDDLRAS